MNRKIKLGIGAFLLFSLLSSCGKKDTVSGDVKLNSLQVKINGKEKSFSNVQARWVDGGNYLEINSTDNGSEWVSITVLSETTRVSTGQYSLDDESLFTILGVYSLTNNQEQLNYTATRGTLAPEDAFSLKIDKINNTHVEGSFSAVAVRVEGATTLDAVTLTDGKFNVDIDAN
ncbi:hypothetical protein [Sphingobacterium sp. LRF_L2]|uniref:hypothetical protein n=1 Tax=Sphingobacterium sp. LRF_L2 TaxID=3369421 RepID=UPI003F61B6C8